MQLLKQSTEVKVRVGPFLDATDGVTPETGVTLSGADQAELLKHNGAATVDISGNTWAAVTGCAGWYDLTVTTSNTDTLGQITAVVQDSSVCLPCLAHFMVVPANVWDSLFSTDKLQVDVREFGSSSLALTTQMKADVNAEADTALTDYDPPTKTEMDSGFTALNDPTAASIADAVWDEAIADHTTATSFGAKNQKVVPSETAADYKADVSNLDVAVSTRAPEAGGNIASIKAKTDNLPADPASETNVNATETKVDTIDTVVDAIKAKTDNLPADPADDSDIDTQLATIAGYVDALETRLTETRAGYLDELNASGAGKTAYYVAKLVIALLNKTIITEATGDTEQFNDANVSLGSITGAYTSDGTYTIRKRMVV